MSERERIKRPRLERDRPIRDRSGLFGQSRSSPDIHRDPEAQPPPIDPTDPIARAVDTGYRVIEEYMRQGEQVARQFGGGRRSIDPARVVVDAQDRITQMTQLFSDMAGLWLELVQDAVQQGNGQSDTVGARNGDRLGGAASDAGGSAISPAAVNLVLHSTRSVSGHVDLRPEYATVNLQIHDLRGTAADQPRITDVSFAPATDTTPARIAVRIPTDQPAGRYNAVLVEESGGRLAGTISIIVEDAGTDQR